MNKQILASLIILISAAFTTSASDQAPQKQPQPPKSIQVTLPSLCGTPAQTSVWKGVALEDASNTLLYFREYPQENVSAPGSYSAFQRFINTHYRPQSGTSGENRDKLSDFLAYLNESGLDQHILLNQYYASNDELSYDEFFEFIDMLIQINGEGNLSHNLATFASPLFSITDFCQALKDADKTPNDVVQAVQQKNIPYDKFHAALVLFDAGTDTETEKLAKLFAWLFAPPSNASANDEDPPSPTTPEEQAKALGLYINTFSWDVMNGRDAVPETKIHVLSNSDTNPDNYLSNAGYIDIPVKVANIPWGTSEIHYYMHYTTGSKNKRIRNHLFLSENASSASVKWSDPWPYITRVQTSTSIVAVNSTVYHDKTYYTISLKLTQVWSPLGIPAVTHTFSYDLSSRKGFINYKYE